VREHEILRVAGRFLANTVEKLEFSFLT
jgi:hypothetical protein